MENLILIGALIATDSKQRDIQDILWSLRKWNIQLMDVGSGNSGQKPFHPKTDFNSYEWVSVTKHFTSFTHITLLWIKRRLF
jgi:hypothetical protein